MTTQKNDKLGKAIAKYSKAIENKQAKKETTIETLREQIENLETESQGLEREFNKIHTVQRLGNEANYLVNVYPSNIECLAFYSGIELNPCNMSDNTKEAFKTFGSLLAVDY